MLFTPEALRTLGYQEDLLLASKYFSPHAVSDLGSFILGTLVMLGLLLVLQSFLGWV